VFSGCGSYGGTCSGDTLFSLHDQNNVYLSFNNDYCGYCSQISLSVTSGCKTFKLEQGCVGNNYCSGQTTIYSIATPTFSPTAVPTSMPTTTQGVDGFLNLTALSYQTTDDCSEEYSPCIIMILMAFVCAFIGYLIPRIRAINQYAASKIDHLSHTTVEAKKDFVRKFLEWNYHDPKTGKTVPKKVYIYCRSQEEARDKTLFNAYLEQAKSVVSLEYQMKKEDCKLHNNEQEWKAMENYRLLQQHRIVLTFWKGILFLSGNYCIPILILINIAAAVVYFLFKCPSMSLNSYFPLSLLVFNVFVEVSLTFHIYKRIRHYEVFEMKLERETFRTKFNPNEPVANKADTYL